MRIGTAADDGEERKRLTVSEQRFLRQSLRGA